MGDFMKVLCKNEIYVQRIDLVYLYNFYPNIPDTIYYKIIKECIKINNNNSLEFIKFNKKEEIDFFNNVEYILDIIRVKSLDNMGKEKLCESILNKALIVENKIKQMPINNSKYIEYVKIWELYNYMYYSLNYIRVEDEIVKKLIKEKN